MSFPRSDPVRLLYYLLCAGGLLCVAVLTLVDRGATRAYATPWTLLFWFAHIAPLLALGIRIVPGAQPLATPCRAWCALAAVFAGCVLVSALQSPFRGPSLLVALTPLAGVAAFFLVHDLGRRDDGRFTSAIVRAMSVFSAAILVVSLGHWSLALVGAGELPNLNTLLNYRNEFPLGHSNYTAGLALIVIPWCGWSALRAYGLARAGWTIGTVLGLVMLCSSGSRGGFLGAAALAIFVVLNARVSRRTLVLLVLVALTLTVTLGYAHPRFRTLFFSRQTSSFDLSLSNIQRSAMALAGWRMGSDRPVLGWGPGTTPLAYPRYRAGLDGGVENALQLHSTPVQIWADLGAAGMACALAFFGLIWRDRRTRLNTSRPSTPPNRSRPFSPAGRDLAGASPHPLRSPALATLTGYGVAALTDFQLDVPVFTLVVAGCAAVVATPGDMPASRRQLLRICIPALLVLGVIGIFGHRDPAPELNVQALIVGNDPVHRNEAVALLQQSLALNPDQEIAHFNLGWLLVVRDPVAAERYFLSAAHLVPDKGGVYFGLALSRMNQGRTDQTPAVVRALALECLNDPAFLISPWWRQPDIAVHRTATVTELYSLASSVALRLAARNDRRSRAADYIAVLGEWLDGRSQPGEILRRTHTSGQVSYFAARPRVPEWKTSPVKSYRRERTAYPILMRNLDLPTPVDLFDVQENSLATDELAALFPSKGWLPAPLLIELLEEDPNTNAGVAAEQPAPSSDR